MLGALPCDRNVLISTTRFLVVDDLSCGAIDLHEVTAARIPDLYDVPFFGHYCMPVIDCAVVETACALCLPDKFARRLPVT